MSLDMNAIRPLVERYKTATPGEQMQLALAVAEQSPTLLAKVDELTAELAKARKDRDEYAHDNTRVAGSLIAANQTATFRQGVIDRHRAELGAAGEVLAVVRDAQERIERALATYDTQPTEATR